MKAIPDRLPAQIACLGQHLVTLIQPWVDEGRAVAIDSTVLRARGGVWHQTDREQGIVPHTSIDTEPHWTQSGWHGWVYGWKLHLVCTVAAVWIPLQAELTPANGADNEVAPDPIRFLPDDVRLALGDLHDNAPNVHKVCEDTERFRVTPQYGKYPHQDPGVQVRRIFHRLRTLAIENFHEHFKGIFEVHAHVPTKGLAKTRRFA